MFAVAPILSILAAAAIYVRADPTPSEPAPGKVYTEGQTCTISWAVDTTGSWKTMDIELMTGDNFNMVYLNTVGTVDGTTDTSFSYTCPKVTPHSPIYFYQFTTPGSTDKTWTGRFTITDSPKNIVPPTESTQPDGQQIPWGTGSLVNGTSTPSSSGSSGSSSTPSSSGSSSSAKSSSPHVPSPSTLASTPTVSAGSPLWSAAPSVVYLTTDGSSAASTTSLPKGNSAMSTLSVSNVLSQTVLALGLPAIGFVVMF